jgi:hypothetical protein
MKSITSTSRRLIGLVAFVGAALTFSADGGNGAVPIGPGGGGGSSNGTLHLEGSIGVPGVSVIATGAGGIELRGAFVTGTFDLDSCLGDTSGDGITSFSDLTEMLAAWGPCACCGSDLDQNGSIGFSDLSILLANWGDCPS